LGVGYTLVTRASLVCAAVVRCVWFHRPELLSRRPQEEPDVLRTVWVKRMDVQGARYSELDDVDLQQTVSKLTARWVALAKLDVDPSLVTLRLVRCGSRKPTTEDEKAAVVLDDPRLSLVAAGVTEGCSLLVDATFRSPYDRRGSVDGKSFNHKTMSNDTHRTFKVMRCRKLSLLKFGALKS